ncbi:succinatesemialdehyde dehydrogenase, partial [Reticulomyxa filosa]
MYTCKRLGYPRVALGFSPRFFSSQRSKGKTIVVDNPYTGAVHCEVPLSPLSESLKLLTSCSNAQKQYWNETQKSLESRQAMVKKYIKGLKELEKEFATEITESMGKPLRQSLGEVNTMLQRAEAVLEMSTSALADEVLVPMPNINRTIRKEPVGTVFVIAPWNYPLLCSINSIIPALLAGNSILFKMSSRTPRIADLFAKAAQKSDFPKNLITPIHCDHEVTTA